MAIFVRLNNKNQMKKFLSIFAILACTAAMAQNKVYSVTACPGQDASNEIRISWAADTDANPTFVMVSEETDKNWKNASFVEPEQKEYCTTYDSVYSKTADGENYYENVKFTKCGASLKGLKPDTRYKYAICCGPQSRKAEFKSDVRHFKTAGAEEWSTCVISDFHCYPPLGHRLTDAMAMVNTIERIDPSIDWIMHVGDVCAWGGSYSFWKGMYEQKPFQDYMWAGVNGNHDNMTRKYGLSHNFFRDTDYYPRNGYAGQEGVCYWFRYNQALFLTLNNEEMHSDKDLLDAQRWVKKVVEEQKASANPPTYIIVMEHYQWFYAETGRTSQYNRWHELFDELGVDLAIAGNNHIYARTGAIFDDKKTDGTFGTVYLQTPSADNERGMTIKDSPVLNTDKIEYRWSEGGKTVGALNMKFNSKQIEFTLYDRNGSPLDKGVVLAKAKKVTKPDIRGQYMRDSLEVEAARCAKTLKAAYMADKKLGVNKEIPGWEGYPVELYEYHTGVDSRTGGPKKALVYMLNPDPVKLAKWIINAVYDATGDVDPAKVEQIRRNILYQSGAQFPVKGVVYEAMYRPGEYYPYIFKDGVTVYMEDEAAHKAADENPGDELLNFYLNMDNSALKSYTGRYARICSTTREMYYNAGGTEDVGFSDDGKRDLKWLDTVAKLYKEAWNSDRNFLIYSWALWNFNRDKNK